MLGLLPAAAIILLIIACLAHLSVNDVSGGRTVVAFLGSGGHTRELLPMLQRLKEPEQLHLFIARNDALSLKKAAKYLPSSHVHLLRRARRVNQSYFSSIFTSAAAFAGSLRLLRRIRPVLLLLNGPGTCVPIWAAQRCLELLGASPRSRVVFMESFCRVNQLSLTGRLLAPDMFIVQWPKLKQTHPSTKLIQGLSQIPLKASEGTLRPKMIQNRSKAGDEE